MRGTPKTLNGAIQNAFLEFKANKNHSEQHLRKLIKLHVEDWIANQVQSIIVLEEPVYEKTWKIFERLVGRKIK